MLQIAGKSNVQLHFEIYNTVGQLIEDKQQIKQELTEINISHFQTGLYLILLTDEDGNQHTLRFVKGL